ncbi:rhodanese-like domain-containing protein, partial [Streptococcus hyovaginalis]
MKFSDITHVRKGYIGRDDSIKMVHLKDMLQELQNGAAVLIAVRQEDEYKNKVINGALALPVEVYEKHISSLPKDKKIIAYCRGPYCAFATQAVETLNSLGYEAYRMEEG